MNRQTARLHACLKLMEEGATLQECLAWYPDDAEELKPLLLAARSMRARLGTATPPDEARLRSRVMAAWDRPQGRASSRRRWSWPFPAIPARAVAMAAAFVLVLVTGGVGTVAAASSAIPGQALYPVKEVREHTQLWLARSPDEKVATYTFLVKERVDELQRLTAEGDYGSNGVAVGRLTEHVRGLDVMLASASPLEVTLLAEAAAVKLQAGDTLRDTWEGAPEEARPGLEQALAMVDRSAARVNAAVEQLRESASGGDTP